MARLPAPTLRPRHAGRLALDLVTFAAAILLLQPEATG